MDPTQRTLACQDAAIYRAIYTLRRNVYRFPGLLVHHSTRSFHHCYQKRCGGLRKACLRDVGARKRQLFVSLHTTDLLCFAGLITGELRALIRFLHAHHHVKVIQIIWFGMICRVAYRVVTGHGASDDRSDEENE